MPIPTQGVKMAAKAWVQLDRESCPTSFMPRDKAISPRAPKKMTPARVACFLKDTSKGSGVHRLNIRLRLGFRRVAGRGGRYQSLLAALLLGPLATIRAGLQECLGFNVKPLALLGLEDGFPDDAEGGLGAEVILVVKLVN